jgi:hypothetical protein
MEIKDYPFDTPLIPDYVLRDADFKADGWILGNDGDIWYAVLDPARHPLDVWKKKGAADYEATAEGLNSVVFTNGPQMDDPAGTFSKGMVAGTTVGGW